LEAHDQLRRLADSSRRKDELISLLAHQLRNPLAPIRNSLYVLEVSPDDPQVVEEMRGIMRRQIEHLVRLVDDLLDVSRITRGLIVLRREAVDLAEVVRQSLVDYERRAEVAGLAMTAELPGAPVWLDADPTRLKQVLDNLLGNALKFTDRGGSVTIRLEAVDPAGEVRLSVRDTGIGLDREILPRLFEPFAQADRTLDRSRGGLGLGLALVRGLVELHGGSVEARSDGPGRGAEFLIRLRGDGAGIARAADRAEPTTAARRRVLVIEDHRDSAETLRRILDLHGYDVAVAHDGPTGLEETRQTRPDVVICDIGLPGMDGFAVAASLRADPALTGIRLIALSGYGREEDIRRARDAGFDGHIVKPASPDALVRQIEGRDEIR
jgi:CheY-like chemotaxis protein/two-component sensor histidine kinase